MAKKRKTEDELIQQFKELYQEAMGNGAPTERSRRQAAYFIHKMEVALCPETLADEFESEAIGVVGFLAEKMVQRKYDSKLYHLKWELEDGLKTVQKMIGQYGEKARLTTPVD